jgi:hypothetical protein
VNEDREFSTRTIVGGKAASSAFAPVRTSLVDEDGWYWIEATIRRPKPIDESLFLDLVTDVSDSEFF